MVGRSWRVSNSLELCNYYHAPQPQWTILTSCDVDEPASLAMIVTGPTQGQTAQAIVQASSPTESHEFSADVDSPI